MDKFVLRLAVVVLGAIAIASRLVPHEYNFAAFGAFALFCGCFLRGISAWVVPLAAYLVSEALGRATGLPSMSNLLLFSILLGYSLSVAAGLAIRFLHHSPKTFAAAVSPMVGVLIASLAGSIGFFLVTNFASWLDPRMQYPQTLAGLINSYVMGIPFYRTTLVSDLVFGQVFFGSFYAARALVASPSQKTVDNA
jgi:hypothetical protein